jgi:hypothetical protein
VVIAKDADVLVARDDPLDQIIQIHVSGADPFPNDLAGLHIDILDENLIVHKGQRSAVSIPKFPMAIPLAFPYIFCARREGTAFIGSSAIKERERLGPATKARLSTSIGRRFRLQMSVVEQTDDNQSQQADAPRDIRIALPGSQDDRCQKSFRNQYNKP